MKIIDNKLLSEFRTPGRCEHCKAWCEIREPHHLWGRGMGGGSRLDIRINLISLGQVFQCPCHRDFHDGHILKATLLALVAAREGCLQSDIEREIWRLRRAPKGSVTRG